MYLTALVDVYSRRILAHRVAITMQAIQAKEVLQEARHDTLEIVNNDQGGAVHSLGVCRVGLTLSEV